ncbi:YceI family protein [Zafaria sp. Z1313]|uniref:YceI family protein n=1 Tax=unclassified Zafaria TaxID=2828765 RepID=UPI002E77B2B3|nr:YceI family protein [Zafaria sp. J156]MEE1621321.1 YceI family protein [Zafaria sp. J156]
MRIPEGITSGRWTLDPTHSEVGFTIRYAGISKVRGRFTDVESVISVGPTVDDSALYAVIQAVSFDSRDPARDTHVRSPDFFDVERFPTLGFTATSITGDGHEFLLTGDLTIRDVTRAVELSVEYAGTAVDPAGVVRAGFSAETVISRKDFGLTWNAALEAGGVLVGDKVTIVLDVAFIRSG